MLLYWQYCDQNKDKNTPAIASKYYKTLRNLEDCKCMLACNGVSEVIFSCSVALVIDQ